MLHEFITTYRDAIIERSKQKLTDRPWPLVSTSELEHGVPLFLTQLSDTLRWETTATPVSPKTMGASAVKHGSDLRALGFNVSQVVHDYGDICQAITEVAVEQEIPITTEEFRTLNRCLDSAIADAVTEHSRITAKSRATEEVERSGQLAHEIRDLLNTALLALHTLKQGTVAINGSTGTILSRSLMSLRELVDTTLSDVRMSANIKRSERVQVAALLNEIAVAANLHADARALQFTMEPVDPLMVVDADPQLLTSALMNLLSNAFKFTHAGGRVVLRTLCDEQRVLIEVEDQCGGILAGIADPFQPFADRRQHDRSGLGLGLSIARKAVRMHGGDVTFRNVPGIGCVFVIGLPLAVEEPAIAERIS